MKPPVEMPMVDLSGKQLFGVRPGAVNCCEACVYERGEHAAFCEQQPKLEDKVFRQTLKK